MDRTATMVPRREPLKVTKVFQVSRIEFIFSYYDYSPSFHISLFSRAGGQRCGIDLLRQKCSNRHTGRKSATLQKTCISIRIRFSY